jgi:2,4-dienoyl-CoA reductase-like NADH-dependent reductase (Old Yellow Enzyme family)
VHESAHFVENCLMAHTDACIPGYREMAARVHAHGCKVFGQLFHPGKEVLGSADGSASVAYAPSAIPNERYKVMPRAMSGRMVRETVAGHAATARRMKEAGLDGVEIVASHGYLPAQFLTPAITCARTSGAATLWDACALSPNVSPPSGARWAKIWLSACASRVTRWTRWASSPTS